MLRLMSGTTYNLSNKRKRVLIFSLAYIPFVSGAELAVKEITDRINDLDFDLITLRFDRKWAKKEKIGNVNIYRIGGGKLFFSFFAFWKARKFHKKNGYDSVWSIMANRAGFAALFFKLWRPKVKYLLTLQEGDTLDYPEKRMGLAKIFIGGLFKKIFTKADYVQAISNYLADWAKNMGAKAPVEVVPNGVSINKYEIRNPKSETNLKSQNSNIKTIITTSRLVRKNGVDTLIKAMAILYVQHRMSNIKLQILGDGQDEKKLKDLAKELNVQNVVRFLGHIEPEYVYKYLLEKYDWDKVTKQMKEIFKTMGRKPNILICTGIYPPDIGGPAKYAKNLTDEFSRNGNKVKVLAYGMEKKMPIGARHFWYFLRTIFALPKADLIIGLDIFSTGFPAVLAGKIFGKKTILRVGGDFLWETYIESTGHLIKLKDFYEKQPRLSLKFKIIALLQKFALKNTSALAFNTGWQKDFFEKIYKLNPRKNFIIENFYPEKSVVAEKINKVNEFNFLFAGRKIKFKNLKLLEEVFEDLESAGIKARLDIVDGLTQKELQEKIKNSYAAITVSISDFAPNFLVESLSYNKPFILTKDCGLAEKLDGLGVIVDPIDKNSIKKAILLLLDENNYKRYKEKIAEFNFTHSWKEIAQEFLAIYKTR